MKTIDYVRILNESAPNARAKAYLDARFGTNPKGWDNWVFDQMLFPPHATVLELGCGPATLWTANLGRLPEDVCILLTDFRESALAEARKRLGAGAGRFGYAVVDAEAVPYGENLFDMVVANRMLYFISDRNKALAEISRVLKPGGALYAATVGKKNMSELMELFFDCFSIRDRERKTVADVFGLENGAEQLRSFFRTVQVRNYANELRATESGPLVEYVFSSRSIREEHLMPGRKRVFRNYLDGILRAQGFIRISRDAGLLIAEK